MVRDMEIDSGTATTDMNKNRWFDDLMTKYHEVNINNNSESPDTALLQPQVEQDAHITDHGSSVKNSKIVNK